MIKLVIALPGSSFTANFVLSLFRFIHEVNTKAFQESVGGLEYILVNGRSSLVTTARELCLGRAQKIGSTQMFEAYGYIGYTHILWIDSDMTNFTSEHLKLLLDMDTPVSTGIYRRCTGDFCVCQDFRLDHYNEHLSLPWLSSADILKLPEVVFQVSHTGMGFMLVQKGVFEELPPPCFRTYPLIEGAPDLGSEDVCFCEDTRKRGIRIFANKNVMIGHEKQIVL